MWRLLRNFISCFFVFLAINLLNSQYTSSTSCDDAPFFSCGDDFFIEGNSISKEYLNSCNNYIRTHTSKNIWRSYLGDGQLLQLKPSHNNDGISVYEGSCDDLVCSSDATMVQDLDSYHVNLLSVLNKKYKILLSTRVAIHHIGLESNCLSPPVNIHQSGAMTISCNDTISVDLTNSTSASVCSESNYPLLWYKLNGNDQVVTFQNTTSGYSRVTIDIFESSSEVVTCNDRIHSINGVLSFYTTLGKNYFISVGSSRVRQISFNILCNAQDQNDLCNSSDLIECGDTISTEPLTFTPSIMSGINDFHRRIIGKNQYIKLNSIQQPNRTVSVNISERFCEDFSDPINQSYEREIFLKQDQAYTLTFERYNLLSQESLITTCQESNVQSTCQNALLLKCNDIVLDTLKYEIAQRIPSVSPIHDYKGKWYKIIGNNELLKLHRISSNYRVFIFTNECAELEYIGSFSYDYQWFANQDQEYYLFVNNSALVLPYSLEIECRSLAINTIPSMAFDIECGALAEIDFSLSMSSSECSSSNSRPLYYKYKNTSSDTIKLEYERSSSYKVSLYSADQEDFCRPVGNIFYPQDSVIVELSRGNGPATFLLKCVIPLSPKYCAEEDIIQNICSIHIDLNYSNLLSGLPNTECNLSNTGLYKWYKFEGKDSLYSFRKSYQSNFRLYLLSGECNNLTCEGEILDAQSHLLKDSLTYYLLAYRSINGTTGDLVGQFDIECAKQSVLSYCDNDVVLSCGDTVELNPLNLINNTAYHQFKASDSLIELAQLNYISDQDITYSCSNLAVIPFLYPYVYDLSKGLNYTIRSKLSSRQTEPSSFVINCIEREPPSNCPNENSTLSCDNNEYFLNKDFVLTEQYSDILNRDSIQGKWFLLTGIDKYITIYFHYGLLISRQLCYTSEPILRYNSTYATKLSPSDSLYILTYDSTASYRNFNLYVNCRNDDPDPVVDCSDVEQVFCGNRVIIYRQEEDRRIGACSDNYQTPRQYFKLIGDDNYVKVNSLNGYFSYKLIEGDCHTGICMTRYNPYVFLKKGIEYYYEFSRYGQSFAIEFLCEPPTTESSKDNPIVLNCGSTVELDFRFNKATQYVDSCLTEIPQKGEWLSFIGNGNVVSMDYHNTHAKALLFEIIGQDTICSSDQPIRNYNNYQLNWASKHGRQYLIFIYSTLRNADPFTLTINCFRQSKNDDCSDAILITCATTNLRHNRRGSTASNKTCNGSFQIDQFYSIRGENNYISFSQKIQLLAGGCEDLTCIDPISNGENGAYFLIDSMNYLIKTSTTDDYTSDIKLTCDPGIDPIDCRSAISIYQSDTTIIGNFKSFIPFYNRSSCDMETLTKGVFYRLSGLSQYIRLSVERVDYSMYSGNCKNLVCHDPYNGDNIYHLNPKQDYYLLVKGDLRRFNQSYTLKIENILQNKRTNFNCNTPSTYSCRDTIDLHFNTNITALNKCLSSYTKYYNLYYESNTSKSFTSFELLNDPQESLNISRRLLCDAPLLCEPDIKDIRDNITINDNITYYSPSNDQKSIDVFSLNRNNSSSNVQVKVACVSSIVTDACNSELLAINDSLITDNAFHLTNNKYTYDYNRYRGVWYKLEKSNRPTNLSIYNRSSYHIDGLIQIFSGENCRSLNLRSSWNIYESVELDSGLQHFVLLLLPKKYFMSYKLKYDEIIETNNDFLPPSISCDSTFIIDFQDLYLPDSCFESCSEIYNLNIIGSDEYYVLSGLPNGSVEYVYKVGNTLVSLSDTLFLRKDSSYTVSIENRYPYAYSDQVLLECISPTILDPLMDTIIVSCGDTIIGTTHLQFPSEDYYYTNFNIPIDYYYISGKNNFLFFSDGNSSQERVYSFLIDKITKKLLWFGSNYSSSAPFLKDGVEYILGISPFSFSGSAYSLIVGCEDINPNATCDSPISASCNEEIILNFEGALDTAQDVRSYDLRKRTIFYNIFASNTAVSIKGFNRTPFVFDGPCDEDKGYRLYSSRSPIIIENESLLYLRFFETNNLFDTVTIACQDIEVHDSISNIVSLPCSDTIDYITPDVLPYYKFYSGYGDEYYYQHGLFMKILGDNFWGTPLRLGSEYGDSGRMVEYDNEDRLVLTSSGHDSFFERGKEYCLFFRLEGIPNASFAFTMSCRQSSSNSLCESPREIECDSIYEYNFIDALEDSTICSKSEARTLFYEYLGEDRYFRLETDFEIYTEIYSNCSQLSCIDPITADWYWGEKNKIYLIAHYFRYGTAIESFYLSCADRLFDVPEGGNSEECLTIGQPCDDANIRTVNDIVDENCICQGEFLQDLLCVNDSLFIYNIDTTFKFYQSKKVLISNGKILPLADIIFKSGERVELKNGFEVFLNGLLEIEIEDCPE